MEYYRIRKSPKYTKKETYQVLINRANICWEYLKEFKTLKEANQFIKNEAPDMYNKLCGKDFKPYISYGQEYK